MKDNFQLSLAGNLVQLVPYRRKFVLRYHQWMQSEELLQSTASEPLSLEEEYEMQQTWRDDDKKCTFIVLTTNPEGSDLSGAFSEDGEVKRMIGDVNLFLQRDDQDQLCAEIDIMIAESAFRKHGCGREAVKLMLWYALRLGVVKVFAKIHQSNLASYKLFESLGFVEVNYVAAFEEFELSWPIAEHAAEVAGFASEDCLRPYTDTEDDTTVDSR